MKILKWLKIHGIWPNRGRKDDMVSSRLRLIIPTKNGDVTKTVATNISRDDVPEKVRELLSQLDAEFKKAQRT